jgi:hypothetical protein
MKNIETIKDKYTSIIYNTNNLKDLDKVRISAVGKKGEISSYDARNWKDVY